MNEHELADRFQADVDLLMQQGEILPQGGIPDDYRQMLETAQSLARADASLESNFRFSLQERLRERAERELPRQVGRERVMHNFSGAIRVGFGAIALLAFVLGLNWVLSSIKSNSISGGPEDFRYLTPIPEETLAAYRSDRPIENKLQAVIAARASLGTTRLQTQKEPKVLSVEEIQLTEARQRVQQPGAAVNEDRPGDTLVWLVIFEGDWQVIPPDPGHTITSPPPQHGCTYVILQATDPARTEIGSIDCGKAGLQPTNGVEEQVTPPAASTGTPAPIVIPENAPDLPLSVGTTWVYSYQEYQPATDPNQMITATALITESILENKQAGAFFLARIGRSKHFLSASPDWGLPTSDQNETFWYVIDGQKVYSSPDPLDSTGITTTTLSLVYDLPLAVGNTWCPVLVDLKDPNHRRITDCSAAGKQTVEKKASYASSLGKWDDCYWITQDYNSGGVNQWFCKGVGPVAYQYDHGGTRFGFRQELVRYSPGSGDPASSSQPQLNLQSPHSEIRARILNPTWRTLWIQGQAITTSPVGVQENFYVQAWLERGGAGRVLSTGQIAGNLNFNLDMAPRWVWVSDGKNVTLLGSQSGAPDLSNQRWALHPLEMSGPVLEMIFPKYLAVRSEDLQPVRMDEQAGRLALVVDWAGFRLWVDAGSGVLLRQQNLGEDGKVLSETLIQAILYDPELPATVWSTENSDKIRFEPVPSGAHIPIATHVSAQQPPAQLANIVYEAKTDSGVEIFSMHGNGLSEAGSIPAQLTHDNSINTGPACSPDGKRIAFTAIRDNQRDIYLINPDGSGETRLTDSPADDVDPSFSPDGQKIAFVSQRDGNPEIYVIALDGSGLIRLTDNPAFDGSPAWSPDGKQIAFQSSRDRRFQIYRMNADGTGQANLSNSRSNDNQPTWSPDGEKIAFYSGDRENGTQERIYVMDRDGANVTPLTADAGSRIERNFGPKWSPDGKSIIFYSYREGTPSGIFEMPADGSGLIGLQIQLTPNTLAASNPCWLPADKDIQLPPEVDGQPGPAPAPVTAQEVPQVMSYPAITLTLSSGPQAGSVSSENNRTGQIYFMLETLQSPFRRQLVWLPSACLVTSGPCPLESAPGFPNIASYDLAWSPDARLAAMDDSNSTELLIFDPLRNTWKPVVQNFYATMSRMFWSPDGAWIAATLQADANTSLITLIQPDGSGKRTYAEDLGGMRTPVGWLDANTLLFLRDRLQPKGHPEVTPEPARLYKLEVQQNRWSVFPQPVLPEQITSPPVISPDRSQIALTTGSGEQEELALLSSDGLNLRSLGVKGAEPAWSPDGQWIAFISFQDQVEAIYILRPDGTGLQKVFEGALANPVSWAPDSQHLIVEASDSTQGVEMGDRKSMYWISIPEGAIKILVLSDQSETYNIRYPSARPAVVP